MVSTLESMLHTGLNSPRGRTCRCAESRISDRVAGAVREPSLRKFQRMTPPALQHRGFMDQAAFGEAGEVKGAGVDQVGVPAQDQIRQDLARGQVSASRRVAEAVGEIQARDLGHGPEDGVNGPGSFRRGRPSALGIYFQHFKTRDTVHGAQKNFLNERGSNWVLNPGVSSGSFQASRIPRPSGRK